MADASEYIAGMAIYESVKIYKDYDSEGERYEVVIKYNGDFGNKFTVRELSNDVSMAFCMAMDRADKILAIYAAAGY